MKIVVLGTRGFPNVPGGVEKHCEQLYPKLVRMGHSVTVFARSPYTGIPKYEFKGVNIVPLDCPKNKFLEAFFHTFKGLFAAKKEGCDVIHIHAVGPAVMIGLAKLMGFKVVFTHHGPDYERKKWNNPLAQLVLRLGEMIGVRFADQVITIADYIADKLKKQYGRSVTVIPNGVVIPEVFVADTEIKRFGLEKGKYILAVGRFVPEKGFQDLIEAYRRVKGQGSRVEGEGSRVEGLGSRVEGEGEKLHPTPHTLHPAYKLVIAGDADHEDDFSRVLKKKAGETPGVILTGYITGKPLYELYSHAGLFVLPSYYEGLPIVLLEAMSYGLSCIASDIPANRNVDMPEERFFKPGDIQTLSAMISKFTEKRLTPEERDSQISMIRQRYDWDRISGETLKVYQKVANRV